MTVAVCTNCGELKYGAWCTCPACQSEGLDGKVNILLSDHNLSDAELERISDAVGIIYGTGLEEEKRFHLLAYYLSRKWPKLLEYDIDAVELEFQELLDTLYRSKLAHLSGQKESNLRVSPIHNERTWTAAAGGGFQEDDDVWQAEVRGLLLDGMAVAKQIVSLNIKAGEGAVLQKFMHYVRTVYQVCDYRPLAAISTELIDDAKEYQRTVNRFCSRVRNGWSGRTKDQAGYFRGLCQRIEEMANHSRTIIEHKAGINRLIGLELKRVRQEFCRSYATFIDLSYVVMDPTRITRNVERYDDDEPDDLAKIFFSGLQGHMKKKRDL